MTEETSFISLIFYDALFNGHFDLLIFTVEAENIKSFDSRENN